MASIVRSSITAVMTPLGWIEVSPTSVVQGISTTDGLIADTQVNIGASIRFVAAGDEESGVETIIRSTSILALRRET